MFLDKDHHPGTVAVIPLFLERVTACRYYPECGQPAEITEDLTIESLAVDLSNIAKSWDKASELTVAVDHGRVNRMEAKVNSLVQHAAFNPAS